MHQDIGRAVEARKGYSPLIKKEILHYWRVSKGRVFYNNVHPHEMTQWDVLENKHGLKGLRLDDGDSLRRLRSAPPPPLSVRGVFKSGSCSQVLKVVDIEGSPVEWPANLTHKERLLYHVVRELTLKHRVCTHADIAHALWPRKAELPRTNIVKVMVCRLNKKLAPECIKPVFGRGYRWISAKVL